jgi:hypothetical protein
LPRSHKHVLVALLAYARPDLTVYHAQSQLAVELDYSQTYIREILTHLTACRILGVVGTPRQHYATEYAIDLGHLPDRPIGLWRTRDHVPLADASGQRGTEFPSAQSVTQLPPEQGITQLPPERNSVAPRCNGLHSQKARPALQGPGQPTFAAPITPRGTEFGAPETALRHAGLHSIAAGPQSLPLTARPRTGQPYYFMLLIVLMEYTLKVQGG